MKKLRLMLLVLLGVLFAAALAGCGGGSYYFLRHVLLSGGSGIGPSAAGAGEESAADETAAEEETAEPITLTVMNRIPESYRTKGNPVLDAIAERTGVTLDIRTLPMSNYNERFQVVLTSGELCDIRTVSSTAIRICARSPIISGNPRGCRKPARSMRCPGPAANPFPA